MKKAIVNYLYLLFFINLEGCIISKNRNIQSSKIIDTAIPKVVEKEIDAINSSSIALSCYDQDYCIDYNGHRLFKKIFLAKCWEKLMKTQNKHCTQAEYIMGCLNKTTKMIIWGKDDFDCEGMEFVSEENLKNSRYNQD